MNLLVLLLSVVVPVVGFLDVRGARSLRLRLLQLWRVTAVHDVDDAGRRNEYYLEAPEPDRNVTFELFITYSIEIKIVEILNKSISIRVQLSNVIFT